MMRGPEPHTTDFLKQFSSARFPVKSRRKSAKLMPLLIIALILTILVPPAGVPLVLLWGILQAMQFQKEKNHREHAAHKTWKIPLRKRREVEEDPVFHASNTFVTNEDGEVWMSREKQLAQLETFRRAGLLEDEEYRLKREQIENGE